MDDAPLARLIGVPADDLRRLISRLTEARLTVACAESLTGGLLAAVLTEIPGSSAVVRGGLVVYATDLKHALAGVDETLLAERGPVDPDVAVALARGARTACGATVGLGLTGVAGPARQNGVTVGTWYVALVGPDLAGRESELLTTRAPTDDRPAAAGRAAIRHEAVRAAVTLLSNLVKL